MRIVPEIYHHLESVIKGKFELNAAAVGYEGGFPSNILENKEVVIGKTGCTGKTVIGIDVAALKFCKEGSYD